VGRHTYKKNRRPKLCNILGFGFFIGGSEFKMVKVDFLIFFNVDG